MKISQRISNLGTYAFAEVDKKIKELKAQGIKPIDFGVGDPADPTPEFIYNSLQRATEKHKSTGYPSYIGMKEYREKVAQWFNSRFGVSLDPDTEISSTVGSKEAVFHFPFGFVDAGDVVLVPTPGYPPYARGTQFAGGEAYFLPLRRENKFLIDFEEIPEEVAKKAKILWINYPNNPTGAVASEDFIKKAIDFCQKNDIILASDECYTEFYRSEKPLSVLEYTKEAIVFGSLSKRSNMTGYRVGFVAGKKEIIDVFKKVKTNIDSGTPNFIQEAAITALSDEDHVITANAKYLEKMDILADALSIAGLPDCRPKATFYLWQEVPEKIGALNFLNKLLSPEVGIVCTPGAWISDQTASGENPGENFVRFSLTPTKEKVIEAAEKIKKMSF